MKGIIEAVAIVSDGGKSELIRLPNGGIVIDSLEDVIISAKGTKVLSQDEINELRVQNEIPTYKCNVKK